MGAFEYTALDGRGRQRRGTLEGETPRQVRQRLREQGLTPLAVEAVERREVRLRASRAGLLRRGLGATEVALLTRQLATLVRAGTPLAEALTAVAEQSGRPRVRRVVLGVRARVLEGHSLAAGLGAFPHVFPELYRVTVEAGEQAGRLDGVLEGLADYLELRQQQRQKVTLALVYPALLTGVAVLIVAGLLAYVVPEVVQVFEHIHQQLPWLTRALIAASGFLQAHGALLGGGLLALWGLALFLLRRPALRRRWDGVILRLPFVGRLVRGLNAGRFARTLSILTRSGVSAVEALAVAGPVMGRAPLRAAVAEAAARVREGESIHRALGRSRLFPPMLIHLVASGEGGGQLDALLERAAQYQERESDTLVAALLGLLEPLLILAMGGVVLAIVVAILLPIFELNQLVR